MTHTDCTVGKAIIMKNSKMFKGLIFVLVVAFLFTFASCGGRKNQSGESDTSSTVKETTKSVSFNKSSEKYINIVATDEIFIGSTATLTIKETGEVVATSDYIQEPGIFNFFVSENNLYYVTVTKGEETVDAQTIDVVDGTDFYLISLDGKV